MGYVLPLAPASCGRSKATAGVADGMPPDSARMTRRMSHANSTTASRQGRQHEKSAASARRRLGGRSDGKADGADGIGAAIEHDEAKAPDVVRHRHVLAEGYALGSSLVALLLGVVKIQRAKRGDLSLAIGGISDQRQPQLAVVLRRRSGVKSTKSPVSERCGPNSIGTPSVIQTRFLRPGTRDSSAAGLSRAR